MGVQRLVELRDVEHTAEPGAGGVRTLDEQAERGGEHRRAPAGPDDAAGAHVVLALGPDGEQQPGAAEQGEARVGDPAHDVEGGAGDAVRRRAFGDGAVREGAGADDEADRAGHRVPVGRDDPEARRVGSVADPAAQPVGDLGGVAARVGGVGGVDAGAVLIGDVQVAETHRFVEGDGDGRGGALQAAPSRGLELTTVAWAAAGAASTTPTPRMPSSSRHSLRITRRSARCPGRPRRAGRGSRGPAGRRVPRGRGRRGTPARRGSRDGWRGDRRSRRPGRGRGSRAR